MEKKTQILLINILLRPALIFAGIMCIWYFLAVSNFIGYISSLNYVWVFAGVFLVIIAVLFNFLLSIFIKTKKIIKIICVILIISFSLPLVVIESLIFINARSHKYENAEYIIILGAGLYRGAPSLTLLRRINAAINYSNENPDVKIIVSGGTGEGQRTSEAAAMARVLLNNGINADRIIIEDKSSSTYENLKFSGELISDLNKKIVISSSEFHLFRAKIIAKKLGYNDVGVLASRTPGILLPNYYMREYFAILKTIFFD
ncbi:MAG: YdcF family protein [Treponema sp.]|nr:YdcF family protein [Treponema sp.]